MFLIRCPLCNEDYAEATTNHTHSKAVTTAVVCDSNAVTTAVAQCSADVAKAAPRVVDAVGRLLNPIAGDLIPDSWDAKVASSRLIMTKSVASAFTDAAQAVNIAIRHSARPRHPSHHSLRSSEYYTALGRLDERVNGNGIKESLIQWMGCDAGTWEPASEFGYLPRIRRRSSSPVY
jgi:hypothetical protein